MVGFESIISYRGYEYNHVYYQIPRKSYHNMHYLIEDQMQKRGLLLTFLRGSIVEPCDN